jgi:hypothetical protein
MTSTYFILLSPLRCTGLLNAWYCSLGAKISNNVILNTATIYEADLIEFGDNVTIQSDAAVFGYAVTHQMVTTTSSISTNASKSMHMHGQQAKATATDRVYSVRQRVNADLPLRDRQVVIIFFKQRTCTHRHGGPSMIPPYPHYYHYTRTIREGKADFKNPSSAKTLTEGAHSLV